ncbi:MAG: helix-turn-helix domain-containing protein [Acidobacteria bacterium]|nr:helix-turn-helix domain-containing protein [Acidobacteriota bacterium]
MPAKKIVIPTPEPRLLNIKAAALYLSCTVWALRQLVWAKDLPHVRIGRRLLFDRADLDKFVESKDFCINRLTGSQKERGQR